MIKFICNFNNLLYLSFQLKKYLWNYFSTGFWSIFPYQVKVSRQKAYVKRKHGLSCIKKGEREHIQRFLHKMRFWKFHVLVVQNNGKKMYKKVCCKWKVVCLPPNRPFFFLFFYRSSCLHRFSEPFFNYHKSDFTPVRSLSNFHHWLVTLNWSLSKFSFK